MGVNPELWLVDVSDAKTVAVDSNERQVELGANIETVRRVLDNDHPEHATMRDAIFNAFVESRPLLGSYSYVSNLEHDHSEVHSAMRLLIGEHPRTNPEATLLFVDPDDERTIEQMGLDSNRAYIPIRRLPGRIMFGPILGKDYEVELSDLIQRRIALCPDDEIEKASWTVGRTVAYPIAKELVSILRAGLREIESDFPGYFRLRTSIVEVLLADHSSKWRQLHALPTKILERSRRSPDSLIDSYHGIIARTRRIAHHESLPNALKTVQADLAQMNRIFPWPNNVTCQGSTFGDEESARLAAIGEGIERYCGNILSTLPTLRSNYIEMERSGLNPLNPADVILHSKAQYAEKGFPLVPFRQDLDTDWVPGKELTSQSPAWVPKSLVYVNYHSDHADTPLTNVPSYPGLSAGASYEMAVANGLEEIIERHATMIWWHNAIKLPRIKIPDDLRNIWEKGMDPANKVSAIALPNEFGLPVIAAIVENVKEQFLTIGFGARPDPREALLKGLTEAFTLQEGSRDMIVFDSNIKEAIARGEIADKLLKPWSENRDYLDSFRPDFRDVSDLLAQQQVYLDPRAIAAVRSMIDTECSDTLESIETRFNKRSMEAYVTAVKAQGLKVYVSDITSHDVRSTGLRVTRTIVPGLIPNFPAAFPHLGDHALQRAALRLGLIDGVFDDSTLNHWPLPHA